MNMLKAAQARRSSLQRTANLQPSHGQGSSGTRLATSGEGAIGTAADSTLELGQVTAGMASRKYASHPFSISH
jgi:hypothetical protein